MNKYRYIPLLAAVLFLFSCKGDRNTEETTINIRLKKDPERINPLLFPNPVAREVYQYIHLPLADFDPESLELTPLLIKDIPNEIAIDTGQYKGGVAFDIEIVPEAKWDNGSPVTAEDYLFTLKAIKLPLTKAAKYRELAENISEIVIDPSNNRQFRVIFRKDYTLALETAVNIEIYPRYFYDSLNLLGQYDIKSLNEENNEVIQKDAVLNQFAEAFNSNEFSIDKISGAGPYAFVSWTADQHIVLKKKDDYWASSNKQAALRQGPDNIIFHIIPDELTAVSQLQAGALDIINEISAESYSSLSNDAAVKDKFSFFHPALTKHYFINLNNGDPKLKDVRVRKALAHLLDVDNIIQNLENGMAVRSVGPIHPIKKTFNRDLVPLSYDPEKAKQLFAEADWKDSNGNGILDKSINGKRTELELDILISGQELGKKLAIMLQENAKVAGVKINIFEKDFKLIRAENLKTRKYHLVPAVLSQDIIAWDDMSKWHSENDTPDGSNDMSYRNPATDALIDQIITTKSDTERIALYKKIQKQIYDDQPVIFLYAPEEKIVISNKWVATSTVKRPGYMANTFTLAKNAVPSVN